MLYKHNGKEYDTNNLPVWAQALIAQLSRDKESLPKEVDVYRSREVKSNIVVNSGDIVGQERYLNNNDRIRFVTGQIELHDFVEFSFKDHDPSQIEVHCGGSCVVYHQTSNRFSIGMHWNKMRG